MTDDELKRLFEETRRFFDIRIEAVRSEIQLVAEGVAQTRESLNREANDIRDEVRRTARETQAMIKFSHAELDRRIGVILSGRRVEREGSPANVGDSLRRQEILRTHSATRSG